MHDRAIDNWNSIPQGRPRLLSSSNTFCMKTYCSGSGGFCFGGSGTDGGGAACCWPIWFIWPSWG
uniref:Uncharacterized protein n=1 Tax=Anopheles albimanus TaxID=7167 RepID=A0A182FZC1_ANOAL